MVVGGFQPEAVPVDSKIHAPDYAPAEPVSRETIRFNVA